jgi:hypothetical protein
MSRYAFRALVLSGATVVSTLLGTGTAVACEFDYGCPDTGLDNGSATVEYSGAAVGDLVAGSPEAAARYEWRLRHLCVVHDEQSGGCSSFDFRPCPQEPGRVLTFLVVENRLIAREGDTVEDGVPPGTPPGTPVGTWEEVRRGCIDITALNPPPSPAEVFSYFERLPLPTLETEHQPPGDGLSGLPVIFYTDSPTTQTFTVDIRGFTVVIEATAERFTWHTGDATGEVVSTDPGAPYPNQTIEHPYRSGTYTAHLTVTWGATFTVDGSAPADVPGTTTTDGPPVTFDVLQARPVLTNPYD